MKMKMKKIVLLMTVMMMCGANAYAASKVEVSILAEKEITVMEKGKQIIKRVNAENVIQGDVVFYTLSMINQGDEAATNIALVDPIPDNTVYLNGTAFGAGSDISYSVDGGQHYQKPNLLLLDEPTASLDPRSKQFIEVSLLELAQNLPVLCVTHDIEQAKRLGGQIIFMCEGHLIESGDSKLFFKHPNRIESREFLRWSVCDCS